MFANDRAEAAETGLTTPEAACAGGAFRAAMRQLVGGVCLLAPSAGEARTVTVAALSSDPPSLLVSLDRAHARGLGVGATFGLSVLAAHQQEIAEAFAKGAPRLGPGRWTVSPRGAPWLAEALAAFECEIEEVIVKHQRALLIARVLGVDARRHGGALVAWRGAYDALGWNADELARAVGLNPKGA